jgi:single-strand DNA-binding protein
MVAMMGIECAFSGRVGHTPELRTSQAGKPWASLSVCVSQGNDGSDPQWVQVSVFGETATRICKGVEKGARVYVEGMLKLSTWNDKLSGEQRTGLSVTAWKCERVSMIGRNRARAGSGEHRADEPQAEASDFETIDGPVDKPRANARRDYARPN